MKPKYFIASAVVILIATVLLLSSLHLSSEKEVVQRFHAEQLLDSRQLGREIKLYMTERAEDVDSLFNHQSFDYKNPKVITEALKRFVLKPDMAEIRTITVFDENGRIVSSIDNCKSGNKYDNSDVPEWSSVRNIKNTQFVLSNLNTENNQAISDSHHMYLLICPVSKRSDGITSPDESGKFAGIIAVSINFPKVVRRLLASISADTLDEDTYLLDKNGQILVNTKHPEMIPVNINTSNKRCFKCHDSFEHIKEPLKKPEGTFEYSFRDSPKKLASYSTVEVLNVSWKIIISIPYHTVSGFIDNDLLLTQITVGIISISLILGSILIIRSNRLQIRAEEEAKQLNEKRRLEQEIFESEKQYRTVVDNSPDAIIIHSEGKIVFANPAAVKLVGASESDELIGRSAIEFVHPDERELILNRIAEVVKSGKTSSTLEERFVKLDGEIIFTEVVSTPIFYLEKPALQVLVHDITERKRTELERRVIYNITRGITISSNLDELFNLIHHELGKVLYADNFFIALHDEKKGLFRFPYFADKFDPLPLPASIGKSCTSYVFRTKAPLLLTTELFNKLKDAGEVELVGSPSPSWVGIPLQTPSKIIGVLVLQHYEEEDVYSERDIKFLNTVASQLAIIIERRYAEEDLKEKEERMRLIVEGTPYLFFYTQDKQGNLLYISPSVEKITGYSYEEWLKQTHWFVTPNKINDIARERTRAHLRGEFTEGSIIIEVEHADKYPILLEIFESPIIRDGSIIGLHGVAHDITERERTQEELRNERLLLRTVIDNIPDSIYAKDIESRKTLANPTEVRYLKANSEAEIIGKSDFDLYPGELAERFFEDDQSVIKTGRPVINREEYLLDENGQKQWLLTSKLPLKDDKGSILGLVGIGRDITSRKEFEEALRESEVKLKVILESTADGILAIDDKGKVIKTNRRFLDLWHIPDSLLESEDDTALLNYTKEQLINPEEFISKIQQLYGSQDEDLDILYFKDGRTFERFSAPLVMSESSVGRVWSFRDITDRVLVEQEIKKRNEELSRINSEKNKFFSIIAHDLKSPFQGFISLTEIMAREIKSFTLDELSALSQEMNKTAGNLFKLLGNLLEWAQMQRGIMKFLPQDYLLSEIVKDGIEIINQLASKKEIKITSTVPDSIKVNADEKMINSVFRNLLSNAVKFTPKGGSITIEAKENAAGLVQISIRDNGIGMPAEFSKKLFRIEEKVGRKGTEGEESTGLGLLLCKEFVEMHGGRIWVESEVGKGSTFYFTLALV